MVFPDTTGTVPVAGVAEVNGLRSAVPVPLYAAHVRDQRVPCHAGPVPGAEVREALESPDDDRIHAPIRRGDAG